MNDAIADFMRNGGKVVKVQEAIPVTVPELLEYLASCGIRAKYSPSSGTFVRGQRQYSLRKLVEVANTYRSAQQLPPLAIRAKV